MFSCHEASVASVVQGCVSANEQFELPFMQCRVTGEINGVNEKVRG